MSFWKEEKHEDFAIMRQNQGLMPVLNFSAQIEERPTRNDAATQKKKNSTNPSPRMYNGMISIKCQLQLHACLLLSNTKPTHQSRQCCSRPLCSD